jgi:hypothetical protein
MPTRTIVTSQPQVACDVCERTLLRGEQPDIFVAAGRRLVVCELCAPRAVHEGWMRESESSGVTLPPTRPRRGRSLLDRLRQAGGARPEPGEPSSERGAAYSRRERGPRARPGASAQEADAEVPFDGAGELGTEPSYEGAAGAEPAFHAEPDFHAAPASYPAQAVAAFNASEFPRRVCGVARSLGPPEVSVRSAEHLASVVVIVVAWELCWYRYEVDLSDGIPHTRVLEQGTELSELPHDDRLANAEAGDGGTLSLFAG